MLRLLDLICVELERFMAHGVPSFGFLPVPPSQPSRQASCAPCNLTLRQDHGFLSQTVKASTAQHASKGTSSSGGGGGSSGAPPGPRQPRARSVSFATDLLPCLHLPALAGVWRPKSALHALPPPRRHRLLTSGAPRTLTAAACPSNASLALSAFAGRA